MRILKKVLVALGVITGIAVIGFTAFGIACCVNGLAPADQWAEWFPKVVEGAEEVGNTVARLRIM